MTNADSFTVWLNDIRHQNPSTRRSQWKPPLKSVPVLHAATKYEVKELVIDCVGLSKANRDTCLAYIKHAHIYPALIAYTFLHIKCRTNDLGLLSDLEASFAEWQTQGEFWSLRNRTVIRDALTSILDKAPVTRHAPNIDPLIRERGTALDLGQIAALVAKTLNNTDAAREIFALRDDAAQDMIDLLQALLESDNRNIEDPWYRRCYLDALIRLSKKSGRYPMSLVIHNLEVPDPNTRPVGQGGFGEVFQARMQGRLVAIKKLKIRQNDANEMLKTFAYEVIVWWHIRHPNCLPLLGVHQREGNSYMVSLWMENGTLNSYITRHPETDRNSFVLDVASGLEYLHTLKPHVCHGDLNGNNVLVTPSGRACVADFGFSTSSVSQALLQTSTAPQGGGTLHYISPELLNTATTNIGKLDQRRCDMYSFGCVCYELYSGHRPFYNLPAVAVQARKLSGHTPGRPTEPECISRGLDDGMWSFMSNLWLPGPKSRATATEALRWLLEKKLGNVLARRRADEDRDMTIRSTAQLNRETAGYPLVSWA